MDVRQFFRHGALVRREVDRDFDGRVDLKDEFDSVTHELVRSLMDVDRDGTADLLVLFRRGQPVFSQRTDAAARRTDGTRSTGVRASQLRDDSRLTSLEDPFREDPAVTAADAGGDPNRSVGRSTSGGLPSAPNIDVLNVASARLPASTLPRPFSISLGPHPPRGPPAGSFLTRL